MSNSMYTEVLFVLSQIMEPPTVSEILAHCEVTDAQLENPCSNEDITAIAGFLISWRTLAPHFRLDESEEEEIEEDGREEAEKKLKALRKWKSKFAHKASYKVLVKALVKANMAECAEKVCHVVRDRCCKFIFMCMYVCTRQMWSMIPITTIRQAPSFQKCMIVMMIP